MKLIQSKQESLETEHLFHFCHQFLLNYRLVLYESNIFLTADVLKGTQHSKIPEKGIITRKM